MQCPLCGYMMSAFDKECLRCHGKGIAPPVQPTPPAQPDPTVPVAPPTASVAPIPYRVPAAPVPPQAFPPHGMPPHGAPPQGYALPPNAQICERCGGVGQPVNYTPGSFLIELLLWFMFCVPGVIYSLWRLSARRRGCPRCQGVMIPVQSPGGAALYSRFYP